MRIHVMQTTMSALGLAALVAFAVPAFSQEKPANNLEIIDEKAQKLLDEWIAIENDDAKRRGSYVPKVMKALPPKKAARYLQIENEYRILLKYDLAATVPLVQ